MSYSAEAERAYKLILKKGSVLTVVRKVPGAYDPTTDTQEPPTEQLFRVPGLLLPPSATMQQTFASQFDEGVSYVIKNVRKVLLAGLQYQTLEPLILAEGDLLRAQGHDWTIMGFKGLDPDASGLSVLWDGAVRR